MKVVYLTLHQNFHFNIFTDLNQSQRQKSQDNNNIELGRTMEVGRASFWQQTTTLVELQKHFHKLSYLRTNHVEFRNSGRPKVH